MSELIQRNEMRMSQSRQEWTPEQIKLIKDTVCKNATDDELKLFLYVANKTGLDPLTKQIYAVPRWDSRLQKNTFTHQTGIDGFRVVAERSDKYAGQLGPFWCGDDGDWKDVWLKREPPRAAKVGILRSDFREPLWAIANWDSYVQKTKDGKPTQFWNNMGPLMLAKVAEALGLRKAFPQDLSSVYVKEEMDQAEINHHPEVSDTKPVTQKETKKESPKIVDAEIVKENKGDSFSTFEKTPENLVKAITNICSVVCKNMNKTEKLKFIKDELKVKDFRELSTMDIFFLDDVFQALCSKYENELK